MNKNNRDSGTRVAIPKCLTLVSLDCQKYVFLITVKNFPSLVKDTNLKIQKVQLTFKTRSPKKSMLGYIIIKLLKIKKKKIRKVARGKWHITPKGIRVWMAKDFRSEVLEARSKWYYIFKVLNFRTWIYTCAKICRIIILKRQFYCRLILKVKFKRK